MLKDVIRLKVRVRAKEILEPALLAFASSSRFPASSLDQHGQRLFDSDIGCDLDGRAVFPELDAGPPPLCGAQSVSSGTSVQDPPTAHLAQAIGNCHQSKLQMFDQSPDVGTVLAQVHEDGRQKRIT